MKLISLAAFLAAALFAAPAMALEVDPNVPPEISLGGRLIATANLSDTEHPVGGNESEAALDIADSSILISAVEDSGLVTRMPPEDDAPALDAASIGLLRRWVEAGAKP